MSGGANPLRGEAMLTVGDDCVRLRPTFARLVAAEAELGPLFALVERAAAGGLALGETVALLWHCRDGAPAHLTRDKFAEALAAGGIAALSPALGTVLRQIVQGR